MGDPGGAVWGAAGDLRGLFGGPWGTQEGLFGVPRGTYEGCSGGHGGPRKGCSGSQEGLFGGLWGTYEGFSGGRGGTSPRRNRVVRQSTGIRCPRRVRKTSCLLKTRAGRPQEGKRPVPAKLEMSRGTLYSLQEIKMEAVRMLRLGKDSPDGWGSQGSP